MKDNTLFSLSQNTPTGYIPSGITDKYLFVVQKNGVDIFDLKTLKLLKTIHLSIDVAEHTTVLGNSFYLISDDTIFKIDSDFNVSQTDYFKDKKLHVKYIYPYKNQLYVVSKLNETNKIYVFNNDLKFEYAFLLPNINYIQGSDSIDNVIWLHTTEGSYGYTNEGKFVSEKSLFPDYSISKLIKDYRGNLWFSSVNKGILIVESLENKLLDKPTIALKTLVKYNNGFLLGSGNGELLKTSNNFINKKGVHKIKENLPTSFIYYVSIAHNTFFSNKGFFFAQNNDFTNAINYDIALKDIVKLDDKYYAFAASNFCGIFKAPNTFYDTNSVWDSVFIKNKSEKSNDIAYVLKNTRGKSVVYNNSNQSIYFATNTGLYVFRNNHLEELKDQGKSFFATKWVSLNGEIYALNTKGNLFRINQKGLFTNISQEFDGVIDNIQFIRQFEKLLLFVCNDTVYTFDGTQIKPINFANNLHKIYDAYLDEDALLVLTNKGIVSLKSSPNENNVKNIFHINNIEVNGSLVNGIEKNKLPYNKNNIRINFSLLDYVVDTPNVYYRINESHWTKLGKHTSYLDFPSLASGTYVVEFKINDEIQKEIINFSISSPFWKTWWFYTIVFILCASIAYGYFSWKSKLMLKQIELLNEKIALEKDLKSSMLSTIKSQMNPHFFYNALNTIQAYIFKNDKLKANNYLAKFSKLTRIILEMSEKEFISLADELDSIKLYLDLEQMRFSDDFEYEINISDNVDIKSIEFPSMLLQPYVENAIKHGLLHLNKEKRLKIFIDMENNNLIVSIDDNGIGRIKSASLNSLKNRNHQSFATKAIDKRLEILNKERNNKITVRYVDKYYQNIATGTTVILIIPTT